MGLQEVFIIGSQNESVTTHNHAWQEIAMGNIQLENTFWNKKDKQKRDNKEQIRKQNRNISTAYEYKRETLPLQDTATGRKILTDQ